ncbi:MAG: cytochrome c biogenesis protein CcdA [Clostridia bacterium]|nr:cytochrome c biogenesis protein CcdA [Clostridia bacterium]
MSYVITFLEGLISFISPCMLPLLPLYIGYFAGGAGGRNRRVFVRALSFVVGFTSVFCLLGLFAGTLGALLTRYRTAVDIVCGMIVILFGLSYLEVIRIPIFKGMHTDRAADSIISAFIFGILYSVSLTPCIGAFLGSALMLASTSGTALRGLLLLLVYSLGLGIPFLISAVLIDKLESAFKFIKKHYRIINLVCGIFLIAVGILMAFGLFGKLMSALI